MPPTEKYQAPQVPVQTHVPQSPPPSTVVETRPLSPTSDEPVPVIRVLSVRGVEYAMMTITLWLTAISLAWVVLNILNGSGNFDFLVVPLSILIISLPIFALLFIRLKKVELQNPALRFGPSKRRLSQLTQVLAFLACLINLIVFVYNILQKVNGNGQAITKSIINLVIILAVAGGILAYYWFDEHRNRPVV